MKKIAVITGASSGMGREFVYAIDKDIELDELWVIARREDRLLELQPQVRARYVPSFSIFSTATASASSRRCSISKSPR